MNNFTNAGMYRSQRPEESFEIAEARKRMENSNMTMTNLTPVQSNMTSINTIPTLGSSMTTGNAEIQQVRQKINQSSSTPLNNTLR